MIRKSVQDPLDDGEGDHCKADFGKGDVAIEKREQTHNQILSFRPGTLIGGKCGNPVAARGRSGDLPNIYETNRFKP